MCTDLRKRSRERACSRARAPACAALRLRAAPTRAGISSATAVRRPLRPRSRPSRRRTPLACSPAPRECRGADGGARATCIGGSSLPPRSAAPSFVPHHPASICSAGRPPTAQETSSRSSATLRGTARGRQLKAARPAASRSASPPASAGCGVGRRCVRADPAADGHARARARAGRRSRRQIGPYGHQPLKRPDGPRRQRIDATPGSRVRDRSIGTCWAAMQAVGCGESRGGVAVSALRPISACGSRGAVSRVCPWHVSES